MLHTSGTTARPKIVPLTQRNLVVSAGNIMQALALTPDDRCLNVMPLFHIHGLMAALLASLRRRRFGRLLARLRRLPLLRLARRDDADLVHRRADDAPARAQPRRRARRRSSRAASCASSARPPRRCRRP